MRFKWLRRWSWLRLRSYPSVSQLLFPPKTFFLCFHFFFQRHQARIHLMFRWLSPFFQVYLIILIPDSPVPGLGVSLLLPGPAPLPPTKSAAPAAAPTPLPIS